MPYGLLFLLRSLPSLRGYPRRQGYRYPPADCFRPVQVHVSPFPDGTDCTFSGSDRTWCRMMSECSKIAAFCSEMSSRKYFPVVHRKVQGISVKYKYMGNQIVVFIRSVPDQILHFRRESTPDYNPYKNTGGHECTNGYFRLYSCIRGVLQNDGPECLCLTLNSFRCSFDAGIFPLLPFWGSAPVILPMHRHRIKYCCKISHLLQTCKRGDVARE